MKVDLALISCRVMSHPWRHCARLTAGLVLALTLASGALAADRADEPERGTPRETTGGNPVESRVSDLGLTADLGPLADLLPAALSEYHLLDVKLWQWIGLLFVAVAAYAVSWLAASLLLRALWPIIHRTKTALDDRLLKLATGPLRLALAVAVFSAGEVSLGLAPPVGRVLAGAEKAAFIVAVTWLVIRLIDLLGDIISSSMMRRGQASATSVVPPARRTAQVVVVGIAALAALDIFGFNVTALLAGLGVGGIAVALAAQKSLENLFGGIMLFADRPVAVGDFCRFGDTVGTIEEIGLRSTRVRTLNRTVVTIPNSQFASMPLDNFAKRDKIWYHPRIGLRYETTPDQIRYVLVEIRKMLYAHPRVDPEPARIRFVGFGAFSLDLDIFAYISATDYGEFLEIAEDINLRIMHIVQQAGSSFAFPSQTMYIEQGEGLPAELARKAEAAVESWRGSNEMYLPQFPRAKVDELRGTLDYPPQGSPMATRTG